MPDGAPVEAVTSLGTFFSTPLAPTFPLILLRRARSVDILFHHAPCPCMDVVSGPLPNDVELIVYWHDDGDAVALAIGRILDDPALAGRLSEKNLRRDRYAVSPRSHADGSLME
jgi:hypothetical protein